MALPLEGIRILELGTGTAVPFAGKLLAELGADVVKVEPPEGDPARRIGPFATGDANPEAGALHLYLNTAKRSVVLPDNATLEGLLGSADVALLDESQDPRQLAGAHPGVILCCVTPFGQDGPYAGAPASELTVQAIGGYVGATGEDGRPPLMAYGHQSALVAGRFAAIGVLALLDARAERGTIDHLELSWLESIAACFEGRVAFYTTTGKNLPRMGNRLMNHGALVELYPVKDGSVAIAPQAEHQWEGLCIAVGRPEWRDDPRLATWSGRAEAEDLYDGLKAWFAGETQRGAMEALQMMRVPSAPAFNAQQVLADPQVNSRRVFETVEHPVAGALPYAAREFLTPAFDPRIGRAPLLGEHTDEVLAEQREAPAPRRAATDGRRPLEHIRVLDLTAAYAGPFAGEILAALGAEVMHVESHLRPDVSRFISPAPGGTGDPENRGTYFSQHNQGKLALNINLAEKAGRDLLLRFVPHVDVILNNFSARVLENWGYTLEQLSALNPGIILVGMPSFGATGPDSGWVCYGEALEAASGLVRARGYGPEEPIRSGTAYPDSIGGITAAYAILAGIAYRRKNGRGISIDCSQREGCLRLMGEGFLEYAMSGREPGLWENRHPLYAPHGTYPARDGEWLAVAVTADDQWPALCDVIGRPDLAADPRLATAAGRVAARAEVDAAVATWAAGQDYREAQRRLMTAGVPAGAVLLASGVIEDEHLVARNFYRTIEHPAIGTHQVHSVPFRFTAAGPVPTARAPLYDEHSRELLRRYAGVDDREYAEFVAAELTGHRPQVMEHL